MSRTTHLVPAAVAVLVAATLPAHAAPTVLEAIDSGFVTEAGGAAKFDGIAVPSAKNNYSVGWELHYADGGTGGPGGLAVMHRKNYFVFDLTAVTTPIASATLALYTPEGGYESADPSEVYEIGATPPEALAKIEDLATVVAPPDVDAAKIMTATELFAMLADTLGPLPPAAPDPMKMVLASAVITSDSEDDLIDPGKDGITPIPLAPEGIDYLNMFLGGKVVLAGAVPTVDTLGAVPQQPFGFTAPLVGEGSTPTPTLAITLVPEPATLALITLTLPALVNRRKPRTR